MAAAAAASGPGFLARANAAALVGNVALAAPTLPRWIATPLNAAAVTTHTNAHANACLPCWRFYSVDGLVTVAGHNRCSFPPSLSVYLFISTKHSSFIRRGICQPKAMTRRDETRSDEMNFISLGIERARGSFRSIEGLKEGRSALSMCTKKTRFPALEI